LVAKWTINYEGVQRSNTVLRIMRLAKDMSAADTVEARAEAVFLRAYYYFDLKKIWNRIPFLDESVTYDNGNYHVKNDTSWLLIENDLVYAMNHLPVVQDAVGRANKYAAEALLAKAYLFEHKYVQAQPLLQDLVLNGKTSNGIPYALQPLYSNNFNAEYKNSSESVFASQSSVNDVSGGAQGNLGAFLTFPAGGETGCCGFFTPSQYLVNHFKTDSVTGLPDLDAFNNANVTSDEPYASNDNSFIPYGGTLDPRLDWTVGRRGIPYLDWGLHPGRDWVVNQDYTVCGPYNGKKSVAWKYQQGVYTQNGFNLATAININLIRYADVLLWAAEAEILSPGGSLEKARGYVNQVRARAMNPNGWVHTYINNNDPSLGFTNIPAANYKIGIYNTPWTDAPFALKAVQYERMLELGMEGHRFYDLVRWGTASAELNAYFLKEKTVRNFLSSAHFTLGKNEYFPIPQSEIDLSAGANGIPVLIQNPGYH
jgi:hypothetical protein